MEREEEEGRQRKQMHVGGREVEKRREEGKAHLVSIRSRMEATVGPDPR